MPKQSLSRESSGGKIKLVYTHIWTELLKLGVSWAEATRMSWGMCRMMFESRAEAWESTNGKGSDVRDATQKDIAAFI